MKELLNKKCIPIKKGTKPLNKAEIKAYLSKIKGWNVSRKEREIFKEYKFKDFIGAINFVNKISEIAEAEGHHPDIHIFYNKVLLELSTHSIGGLSENDFIFAAKVDANN